MRKIPLPNLEIFVCVARHRSFRRAALELQLSASFLSQTMRRLETQLGVSLLRRTTRSVALTEAGEYLLASLVPMFEQVDEVLDGLNRFRSTSAGTIRVNAPGPIAQYLLAPLAARFLQLHPDVRIEIASDAALTDIVSEGYDAGVRFDEELAQDMVAVPLGPDQRYCVVAAPAYVAQRGAPATPGDLEQHSCIEHRFPGGTLFAWCFRKDGRTLKVKPSGPLTVTDALAAANAAAGGAGLAYVPADYARAGLTAGTLVSLLADWEPGIGRPYLYYPRQRQMGLALRRFIDFVKDQDA